MINIKICKYIRELKKEVQYAGKLEVGGAVIIFELTFLLPIDKIVEMQPAEIAEKAIAIFGLIVKQKGREVSLGERDFRSFSLICYKAVVQALKIDKVVGDKIASDGIEHVGTHEFSPTDCLLLCNKFGCSLAP